MLSTAGTLVNEKSAQRAVLGIFGSFYCCTVFKLFIANLAYGLQELNKIYLQTQTLRAGCSKAEPKNFAAPQTPSQGAGQPKFNQLEIVGG